MYKKNISSLVHTSLHQKIVFIKISNYSGNLLLALTLYFWAISQRVSCYNEHLYTNASTGLEAVMTKIVGLGTGNSGRESKITIKRQIERVGVNRRRRERRILSFKDVWRILGKVNSRAQREKVTGVKEQKQSKKKKKKARLIPRLTHALTYRHITCFHHTPSFTQQAFLRNTFSLKAELQRSLRISPRRPSAEHRALLTACRRLHWDTISSLKYDAFPLRLTNLSNPSSLWLRVLVDLSPTGHWSSSILI